MGVLGTVVFAALVLAVQDHQSKGTQAERDPLLNANSATATVASVVANSSSSIDKMTDRLGLQEKREPGASTPFLALTPEINRDDTKAKPGSGTLAHPQDSVRARGPKTHNSRNRSSAAFGSGDVKRRLIELWHQSLAKSEKSRSWTAFSKLTSGAKKKAAYTAETNH
jgi:hypothetical protein